MDNAYKFASARVALLARRNGSLQITVEDDGPGLRDHTAQDLTERGARVDESVPGQGIGLAVVREIVELYQGTLSLEQSGLGGLRVRVTLP